MGHLGRQHVGLWLTAIPYLMIFEFQVHLNLEHIKKQASQKKPQILRADFPTKEVGSDVFIQSLGSYGSFSILASRLEYLLQTVEKVFPNGAPLQIGPVQDNWGESLFYVVF